jgi:hypothetical protein
METEMKNTIQVTIKALMTVALLVVFSLPAGAQSNLSLFTWDISFPMGGTKDFIGNSDPSFRGISYEFRRFLGPQFSVGATLGWQVMNGEAVSTVQLSDDDTEYDGDFTGKHWNYVNAFPLMANAHVYLGDRNKFNASLGVSAGFLVVEERLEVHVVAFQSTKWNFGFAPEVGIQVPFTHNLNGYLGAKYNYSFGHGESVSGEKTNHTYFSINVGIAFKHGFF